MDDTDSLNNTDLELLLNKLQQSSNTINTREELLHELQVHQIELEMQNRELIASQMTIEKARDKYADLFDFAPIGYIRFTRTGCIQDINLTACHLLGKERSTLANKPFVNFLDKDSISNFYSHLKQTLSSSTKVHTEFTIICSDNKTMYVNCESIASIDEQYQPVTLSAIIDITQHKIDEQALQLERNFANNVLETAQSIIVILDTDGKILRVNPYFEKLSGYIQQEIQGKDWFDLFIRRDENAQIRQIFSQAISGKRTLGGVNDIVTRDNQLRTVKWFDSCLKDSAGNITGIIAIGEDITELLAAEIKSIEKENQFQLITDAMPVAITFIDTNENVLFCNNTFQKWFPIIGQQYNGKSIKDVFTQNTYHSIAQFIQSAMDNNQVSCELKSSTQMAPLALFANIIPNINSQNLVDGLFIVLTDISSFKDQEKDLLKHLDSIAHESRLNLIGQMTTEIAHEINQPLTAISTYATVGKNSIINNKFCTQDTLDIFKHIQKQVLRINDIITLLRSFTQKRDVVMENTDINQVIIDLVNLFSSQNSLRNITLNKKLTTTLVVINGNKVLLEQTLMNLLNNAVDALKTSAVENPQITISSYTKDNMAYIDISDNCAGISPDMSTKIFEPFYSTKESGLGLGLSICKTIIDAHHGNIWVTTHNQHETIFTIELPLLHATANH